MSLHVENQFQLTKLINRLLPKKCGLTVTHKVLLLALSDFANNDSGRFVCWPSMDTLAEMSGSNKKTVLDKMRELRDIGIIESKQQYGNKPNIYTFNLSVLDNMLHMSDVAVENRGNPDRFTGNTSKNNEIVKHPFSVEKYVGREPDFSEIPF